MDCAGAYLSEVVEEPGAKAHILGREIAGASRRLHADERSGSGSGRRLVHTAATVLLLRLLPGGDCSWRFSHGHGHGFEAQASVVPGEPLCGRNGDIEGQCLERVRRADYSFRKHFCGFAILASRANVHMLCNLTLSGPLKIEDEGEALALPTFLPTYLPINLPTYVFW